MSISCISLSCSNEATNKKNKIVKILKRGTERIKVNSNKVELYKSCGWIVIEDMFTFKTKQDENYEWMSRFGD